MDVFLGHSIACRDKYVCVLAASSFEWPDEEAKKHDIFFILLTAATLMDRWS